VRWVDRAQAGADTGLALASGGWWYGQAGWLSPGDWSRWLLAQAVDAGQARFQGNTTVARLRPAAEGHGWQALDADGQVLAQASVVVLATALAVERLLPAGAGTVTLQAVRGQTTLLAADTPGLQPPRRALSGQGYGLTLPDGRVFTGATTQHHDPDPSVRKTDHLHNLTRAARLGLCASADAAATGIVGGRVGWRATTADRLPCIGPPLDLRAPAPTGRTRPDGLQHRRRWHSAVDGLYLFTGLGARGITSAALGAQVLAAWVTGAPFPVDTTLRDALDPAREKKGGSAEPPCQAKEPSGPTAPP
jgi:tRNA 5-methylaminomethyl-2-thiouridine biosynthesis bifunctional protein